ncbi:aldehyde dehydrogenase family protein [Streptomyces sp. SID13031]|uniref:aldehyde dehydrogenase family protein n=1 Tax=Streptomyces sp. SID13031 TaxID=2706046 RepID=UPI0013CD3440|nr:aldehyde dehydrogenase family protein [Streptomyces sp. SID13031]NEA30719.1 aldehyde dehydrogenase [Streptomyces sp. SID13031]
MTAVSEASAAVLSDLRPQYGHFIDGDFESSTTTHFPAVNPATGEHLSDLARGGAADIDRAVQAAKAAFVNWRRTLPEERAAMLLRLADAIEADIERLAYLDALDIGRRVTETEIDHRIALGEFRFFAGAALNRTGFNRPIENGIAIARREPLGVIGAIIPWNVPAIMVAHKLAPALAAGNTVVLKPDEHASLSTLALCEHLAQIFPAGVVNVVTGLGEEAGAALTAHVDVRKLAFTGSSEVGRLVAIAAAERLAPVSLELGGKSPNIVFPDIDDIDGVVDNAAFAATYCNGQSCLAGTRLFVHEDVYDDVVGRLVAGVEKIALGSPIDPATGLSCLVSERQGKRVLDYVDIGRKEGAKLLTGGERSVVEGNEYGYFVQPTIFEATNEMRIAQEEIFGPVLSVIRWSNYETMIAQANGVRYGLAAGLYTTNIARALETADRLEVGSVWINKYFNLVDGSPIGGFKDSGYGSENSAETIDLYTHLKSVTLIGQPQAPFYLPR